MKVTPGSLDKWRIQQGLVSYESLNAVIASMSENEVLEALEVEGKTRRRRSIIDRLIARAVRLNEIQYQRKLKEKYHAPSLVKDPGRQVDSGHPAG